METKTFEVNLRIVINVPVQDCMDGSLEVARQIAFQNVQEIRESIPHYTQIDGIPQTQHEILEQSDKKDAIDDVLVCRAKLSIYKEYIEGLDDEFLGYEFNDRGLEEPIASPDVIREEKIKRLVEWCDLCLFNDPKWIPDIGYKK